MCYRWVACFFLLTFVISLAALAAPSEAAPCARERYDHNGSLMLYERCGDRVTISYLQPKPGLVDQGVRNGTLLFDGTEQRNGAISGRSRLYGRDCPPITYNVSGRRDRGGIVLKGQKPVRNAKCKVTDSKPQTLQFTLKGGGASPCPPGFVMDRGQCVREGAGGGGGNKDWYVIALASKDRSAAQIRAATLGSRWVVMRSDACPNMSPGWWVAAFGPTDREDAVKRAGGISLGGYAKKCH